MAPPIEVPNQNQFSYDSVQETFGRCFTASLDRTPGGYFNPPNLPMIPPPPPYASHWGYTTITTPPVMTPPCTPPPGFGCYSRSPHDNAKHVNYNGMRPPPSPCFPPPSSSNCGCCAAAESVSFFASQNRCPPASAAMSNNTASSLKPLSEILEKCALEKCASFNNCNFYCSGISDTSTTQKISNPAQQTKIEHSGESISRDQTKWGRRAEIREHTSKNKRCRKVCVGRRIYKIYSTKGQKYSSVWDAKSSSNSELIPNKAGIRNASMYLNSTGNNNEASTLDDKLNVHSSANTEYVEKQQRSNSLKSKNPILCSVHQQISNNEAHSPKQKCYPSPHCYPAAYLFEKQNNAFNQAKPNVSSIREYASEKWPEVSKLLANNTEFGTDSSLSRCSVIQPPSAFTSTSNLTQITPLIQDQCTGTSSFEIINLSPQTYDSGQDKELKNNSEADSQTCYSTSEANHTERFHYTYEDVREIVVCETKSSNVGCGAGSCAHHTEHEEHDDHKPINFENQIRAKYHRIQNPITEGMSEGNVPHPHHTTNEMGDVEPEIDGVGVDETLLMINAKHFEGRNCCQIVKQKQINKKKLKYQLYSSRKKHCRLLKNMHYSKQSLRKILPSLLLKESVFSPAAKQSESSIDCCSLDKRNIPSNLLPRHQHDFIVLVAASGKKSVKEFGKVDSRIVIQAEISKTSFNPTPMGCVYVKRPTQCCRPRCCCGRRCCCQAGCCCQSTGYKPASYFKQAFAPQNRKNCQPEAGVAKYEKCWQNGNAHQEIVLSPSEAQQIFSQFSPPIAHSSPPQCTEVNVPCCANFPARPRNRYPAVHPLSHYRQKCMPVRCHCQARRARNSCRPTQLQGEPCCNPPEDICIFKFTPSCHQTGCNQCEDGELCIPNVSGSKMYPIQCNPSKKRCDAPTQTEIYQPYWEHGFSMTVMQSRHSLNPPGATRSPGNKSPRRKRSPYGRSRPQSPGSKSPRRKRSPYDRSRPRSPGNRSPRRERSPYDRSRPRSPGNRSPRRERSPYDRSRPRSPENASPRREPSPYDRKLSTSAKYKSSLGQSSPYGKNIPWSPGRDKSPGMQRSSYDRSRPRSPGGESRERKRSRQKKFNSSREPELYPSNEELITSVVVYESLEGPMMGPSVRQTGAAIVTSNSHVTFPKPSVENISTIFTAEFVDSFTSPIRELTQVRIGIGISSDPNAAGELRPGIDTGTGTGINKRKKHKKKKSSNIDPNPPISHHPRKQKHSDPGTKRRNKSIDEVSQTSGDFQGSENPGTDRGSNPEYSRPLSPSYLNPLNNQCPQPKTGDCYPDCSSFLNCLAEVCEQICPSKPAYGDLNFSHGTPYLYPNQYVSGSPIQNQEMPANHQDSPFLSPVHPEFVNSYHPGYQSPNDRRSMMDPTSPEYQQQAGQMTSQSMYPSQPGQQSTNFGGYQNSNACSNSWCGHDITANLVTKILTNVFKKAIGLPDCNQGTEALCGDIGEASENYSNPGELGSTFLATCVRNPNEPQNCDPNLVVPLMGLKPTPPDPSKRPGRRFKRRVTGGQKRY